MKHHLKGTCPLSSLVPPSRSDALAATHASEHNRVNMSSQTSVQIEVARKARETKILKRMEREEKEAKKKSKVELEDIAHGVELLDHTFSFLEAIPWQNPPDCGCVTCGSQVGAGCAVVCVIHTAG